MNTTIRSTILFIASCIVVTSCSHAFDSVSSMKSIPLANGKLLLYPDSNVLVYKNKVGLKANQEVWHPRPFSVRLPKGLIHADLLGDEYYIFYYRHHQGLLIKTDPLTTPMDTTYIPSVRLVDSLIKNRLHIVEKYNVGTISLLPSRSRLIINKDGALIFLYNIQSRNYHDFLSCAGTFHFLQDKTQKLN